MYGRVDKNINPINLVKNQRNLIEQALISAQHIHAEAVVKVTQYETDIENYKNMLAVYDNYIESNQVVDSVLVSTN